MGIETNNNDMKQVSLQVLNVVMLLQEACNGVQDFSHQEIQRCSSCAYLVDQQGFQRGLLTGFLT